MPLLICQNPTCPRHGKRFKALRAGRRFCCDACKMAMHRQRRKPVPAPYWFDSEQPIHRFSSAPTRARNHDGTPALTRGELAQRLFEIARQEDRGQPKTGRRFYYLALSYGYIRADMTDTDAGKKSRDRTYKRVTAVLGSMRQQGLLSWDAVLDLTRELIEWRTYESPREARAALRRRYDEDRWSGQRFFPVMVVEKDTMVPVCRPMAMHWQMPFASSRGYGSLKLQHDTAALIIRREAMRIKEVARRSGRTVIVYFISDLDPSGLDLQRAWQEALAAFGLCGVRFVRIALTPEQVDTLTAASGRPLRELGIDVKEGDSRTKYYIEQYPAMRQQTDNLPPDATCWETDILPPHEIRAALDTHVATWLDRALWDRRAAEIERNRALL